MMNYKQHPITFTTSQDTTNRVDGEPDDDVEDHNNLFQRFLRMFHTIREKLTPLHLILGTIGFLALANWGPTNLFTLIVHTFCLLRPLVRTCRLISQNDAHTAHPTNQHHRDHNTTRGQPNDTTKTTAELVNQLKFWAVYIVSLYASAVITPLFAPLLPMTLINNVYFAFLMLNANVPAGVWERFGKRLANSHFLDKIDGLLNGVLKRFDSSITQAVASTLARVRDAFALLSNIHLAEPEGEQEEQTKEREQQQEKEKRQQQRQTVEEEKYDARY